MQSITLISTVHKDCGMCNPNELLNIIEHIAPDVIFEEIPPSLFDEFYISNTRKNLETDAIKKYSENHKVEQVPVDSDNLPSATFFQDYKFMISRIESLVDINGFNFRDFIDRNKRYKEIYGFQYLNSIFSININIEINDAIKNGLEKINNERLFQINKSLKEVDDKRENEMLLNIYNYSKEHNFNTAIFTVGAAHRKSIIEKIPEFEKNNQQKLNWNFNFFS